MIQGNSQYLLSSEENALHIQIQNFLHEHRKAIIRHFIDKLFIEELDCDYDDILYVFSDVFHEMGLQQTEDKTDEAVKMFCFGK